VKRFLDILTEYEKAPDVTRRRMYIEASADLIGRVDHLLVLDENQRNLLPLYDLNRFTAGGPDQKGHGDSSPSPPQTSKSEEGR